MKESIEPPVAPPVWAELMVAAGRLAGAGDSSKNPSLSGNGSSYSPALPPALSIEDESTDVFWPTAGFAGAVLHRTATDALEAQPKYKSSSPIESPASVARGNKILGFLKDLGRALGLTAAIHDIAAAGKKILDEVIKSGRLLMGEVIDIAWTVLNEFIEKALGPVVGMLVSFGDWIVSVTGLKDRFKDYMNKHCSPQLFRP